MRRTYQADYSQWASVFTKKDSDARVAALLLETIRGETRLCTFLCMRAKERGREKHVC